MSRCRARTLIGLSLGLVLLVTPLSLAQERGGGRAGGRQPRVGMGGRGARGFTMDKATLLRSEQVQTEIKVTEEQLAKVQEAVAAQREAARSAAGERPNFREMSEEERTKYMEDMRKRRVEQTAAMDKKLAGILNKEQVKRLEQIRIQQLGVRALKDPQIAKKLKITEEQTKKIDEAIASGNEARTKLYEGMRDLSQEERRTAFTEMREKTEKIQKDVETKALACLNDKQKEQCKKMKGKEFKLDMQGFRGGGRGQGGARGGRQGGGEGGARRPRGEGGEGGQRRRPEAEGASTI